MSVREVTLDDLYFKEEAFDCPLLIKLDIEFHEIIALIGARRLLLECRPILFIETLCHLQLKTMFTILDNAKYSIAYMVTDARKYWTELFYYQDKIDAIEFAFGEKNIVAVPKEYAVNIFDKYKGMLYPVTPENIKSGELDIKYLNIEVCVNMYTVGYENDDTSKPIECMNEIGSIYPDLPKRTYCEILKHKEENCRQDKGGNFDPFFLDYWKTIEI